MTTGYNSPNDYNRGQMRKRCQMAIRAQMSNDNNEGQMTITGLMTKKVRAK